MQKKELKAKEQVFKYIYDGKTIYIAIDRLVRKIAATPTVEIQIEAVIANKLIADKSCDANYVHKYTKDFSHILAGEHVPMMPGLVIWFKDKTWTLADGNNKYVAAYMAGAKTMRVWEARRQQWAPFLIRDMEESIPHGDPILLAG